MYNNNNNNNNNIPFPDDWDKENTRAVAYFNKCSKFVNSQEELLSMFHIKLFYHIYCYVMIICVILSAILILIFKNNYIIKRTSPNLLIMFCIGCIICISNSYGIQVSVKSYINIYIFIYLLFIYFFFFFSLLFKI